MNADVVCLALGTIMLFFAALMFVHENSKKISTLKKDLKEAQSDIDFLRKDQILADEEIARLERIINKHEDTIGFLLKDNHELDKRLSYIEKKLDSMENLANMTSNLEGINGSLMALLDIVEQEHTEASERAQNASEGQTEAFCEVCGHGADCDGDDVGDLKGSLGDGTPSYRWIFPSEGYGGIRNYPRIGDRYLIVGYDRQTKEIVSGFGTWTGSSYDMDDGYDIVQVYAIVRMPSASDVMGKVLDIRMRET